MRDFDLDSGAAPATVIGERFANLATGSYREGGRSAMNREPGDLPQRPSNQRWGGVSLAKGMSVLQPIFISHLCTATGFARGVSRLAALTLFRFSAPLAGEPPCQLKL